MGEIPAENFRSILVSGTGVGGYGISNLVLCRAVGGGDMKSQNGSCAVPCRVPGTQCKVQAWFIDVALN